MEELEARRLEAEKMEFQKAEELRKAEKNAKCDILEARQQQYLQNESRRRQRSENALEKEGAKHVAKKKSLEELYKEKARQVAKKVSQENF